MGRRCEGATKAILREDPGQLRTSNPHLFKIKLKLSKNR